ncbi:MAG: hypothetical protein ACLGXA_12625 [Acidobacteriota bacterium]
MAVVPISPVSLASATPSIEAAPVSTTVGGKTYMADVQYSAGEYVATDPSLLGAVGTGASPHEAADAFLHRIDFLV